MTALAEALIAAQARAVQALGKAFVAERVTPDEVQETLAGMGLTDGVDQAHWLQALVTIRELGGVAPTELAQKINDRSRATGPQLDYMRKIANERNYVLPDAPHLLSRDDASKVIDSMKAGEYDQAAWAVPF